MPNIWSPMPPPAPTSPAAPTGPSYGAGPGNDPLTMILRRRAMPAPGASAITGAQPQQMPGLTSQGQAAASFGSRLFGWLNGVRTRFASQGRMPIPGPQPYKAAIDLAALSQMMKNPSPDYGQPSTYVNALLGGATSHGSGAATGADLGARLGNLSYGQMGAHAAAMLGSTLGTAAGGALPGAAIGAGLGALGYGADVDEHGRPKRRILGPAVGGALVGGGISLAAPAIKNLLHRQAQ